jgi:hypothetical protein
MIWLAFVLLILANIGALASIARWCRQDRADLIARLLEAENDRGEAEADARTAREQRRGSFDANIVLARKRREADEEAFRVAEEFRQHLDGHGCLPTLDGIRAASVGQPVPPVPVELRVVEVPQLPAPVVSIKRGGRR